MIYLSNMLDQFMTLLELSIHYSSLLWLLFIIFTMHPIFFIYFISALYSHIETVSRATIR